ncbi:MAG: hypothetical protein JNG83_14225 [Opitutaceae bacterium]|nr:hypothetical protein [Opitutaceae bacterium]
MRPAAALLALLVLAGHAGATGTADLGQGLGYLRVRAVDAAALRPAADGAAALVLDLRQATAAADAPADLAAVLAARSAAGAPLFVLVGPETPQSLAAVLAAPPTQVLTLGPAGARPEPRVIVQSDPDADRRAYDAYDRGTPLAELLSGRVEKERFDEATLVQEFRSGNPAPEPPPAPDPTAPPLAGAPAKAAPLTDRVLQRALHLHRALLALRR